MRLRDLKPLPEGIPIHDLLRTTPPNEEIPRGPWYLILAAIVFDLCMWALILIGGWVVLVLVAEWL